MTEIAKRSLTYSFFCVVCGRQNVGRLLRDTSYVSCITLHNPVDSEGQTAKKYKEPSGHPYDFLLDLCKVSLSSFLNIKP
jgi:hypothetical protein